MSAAVYAAAGIGGISALLYLRRKRWLDALLAVTAGAALAAMLGLPPESASVDTVKLDTAARGDALQAALLAVPQARAIAATGDGLHEAQWQDLPARPLAWQAPATDALMLEFERTVPLGRTFALTIARSAPQPGWRLQLLAENGQLLDEATAQGAAARLTVQWLPPVAEQLVLRARVLDAQGKVLQQGPVPVRVVEAEPLRVAGRFGAPSFDTRTLNGLLAGSHALLDWQTVLGKDVMRTETPAAPLGNPNLVVIDAAWFERQAGARAALLAQVARGVPLLILGGSAREPGAWQALRPALAAQSATTEKDDERRFDIAGGRLALAPASFTPTAWAVAARDDAGKPWLWQRDWEGGRILWLGVAEWHRHAIAAPIALGHWWQRVLDHAAAGTPRNIVWRQPDPMPLPGLRTELCAAGVPAGAAVQAGEQSLRWQPRGDGACVALWPRQPGWLTVRSGDAVTQAYVYGANDWPAWQAGLRRAATARYLARSPARSLPGPGVPGAPAMTLPAWPFALLAMAALLALWWRERR
ncbi:hypothetical protein IP92_05839 [Pseudoduganella flava]|uniref:Uncharacterized protein n=1 Tax=Pseudoduganella flava TaxID=871742 RepID=A0A562P935_9BURK|nr:hypothetical protein [Pseudoduganella flava]QGZ40781.1 hypothetical protein GO485_18060 [Pseudoduganella flava]TWI40750.1 hypothetical protein IP92_05839 [Pseudoduganella flava]